MSKTFRIAVYPGDGIGTEVIPEALRVLQRIQELHPDVRLQFEEFDWGTRHWEKTGKVVPDNYLDTLRPFDAILLGAVGWPARMPDHVSLAPLVRLRQSFDQYACLRPAKLYPGVKTVLAEKRAEDIDFVV